MRNTERFTDRVDAYVKYRPGYPKEAIDYLYGPVGFGKESVVADVGAGTGIFSKLLLERGSRVVAVEPNAAMREAAVDALGDFPGYRAVDGTAEETGLADGSADRVVCAQSFHWFDRERAREEFRRILKPGGLTVLIWNTRLSSGTRFLEEYESLLRTYGTDYAEVSNKNISREALAEFYLRSPMSEARFANRQLFDFEGLAGRLLSSSYAPLPGHPNYDPMMEELRRLFDRNERDGRVAFEYETEIYWGEA